MAERLATVRTCDLNRACPARRASQSRRTRSGHLHRPRRFQWIGGHEWHPISHGRAHRFARAVTVPPEAEVLSQPAAPT